MFWNQTVVMAAQPGEWTKKAIVYLQKLQEIS